MNLLTVALPRARPTAGTEFSYVLSDGREQILGHGAAALALLPRADMLVLVIPARSLSWHLAKLPPLAGSRQRAALDGLLEDQLLDEPAGLALALAPRRQADGAVLVAACDKAWLAGALQLFEQAGRRAHRVVPELAPLEPGASPLRLRLVASGTPDAPWLAVVDATGVVPVPLGQARALLPADALDDDGVELLAEPAVASMAEQALGRPASVQSPAQALLASTQTDWELAQFDLATSGRGRMARRSTDLGRQLLLAPHWRALRWGLALALLANLVGLNAWALRLDSSVDAHRTQVRQLLTQTFPKVRTVVDPPLQMERELALLRQSSGALSPRDLEPMLSALGQALPEGGHAIALEFSAGQLVAKGVPLTPEQSALVSGKLSGQGYAVRQDGDRLTVRASGGRQ
jgi:general secretion pathway protein L